MLNEIVMTEFGEVLSCYPGTESRDDIGLDLIGVPAKCIGAHEECGSWIDLRRASRTYNVIVCRGCKLRIVIPIEVNTWNKLKGYFMEQLAK